MKKGLFVLFFWVLIACSVFVMAAPQAEYAGSSPAGGSLVSFLPLLLILVIFGRIVFGGNKKGTPVLVLKTFKLKEEEDEFLRIEGRSSGLWSWVLSLCGIEPVSSLSCNKQSIKFEEAAIRYGKKTLDIPLIAVTGVATGISKPFGLLVLGIIFFILAAVGAFVPFMGSGGISIPCLIIGVVFFLFYSLKKQMYFSVYNGGDKPIAIIMAKKSIIEGQNVDEAKYAAAANALNKAVLKINHVRQNNSV
jgi:hypothetical protein